MRWHLITLGLTGVFVSAGLVVASVDAVAKTSNGFNYTGLAALIASVAGLVSAVGAIIIGTRRRGADPTELALRLLLEERQNEGQQLNDLLEGRGREDKQLNKENKQTLAKRGREDKQLLHEKEARDKKLESYDKGDPEPESAESETTELAPEAEPQPRPRRRRPRKQAGI